MKFFRSFEIAENLIQIEDVCSTKMYLVKGTEKTALLDCGVGIGNIYEYVKTLTGLPLTVLITHGHLDHAMGSGTFPGDVDVYMSPLDFAVYGMHSRKEVREDYFKGTRFTTGPQAALYRPKAEDFPPVRETARIKPLQVGDLFDIGGEVIEICPGAGHTPGCVTMLLREHRLLLEGDAINGSTFLFDEDYSLPVSELKKTLLALKQYDGRYDRALTCHGMPRQPGFVGLDVIDGGIYLCDAILNGADRRIPTKRMGKKCYMTKRFLRKDDIGDHSTANILYSNATAR